MKEIEGGPREDLAGGRFSRLFRLNVLCLMGRFLEKQMGGFNDNGVQTDPMKVSEELHSRAESADDFMRIPVVLFEAFRLWPQFIQVALRVDSLAEN